MSQINTNGVDAEFPIPGENNSSQGFRDNFAQIKNNLNLASDEITGLQAAVVLKTPLEGTVLDNNMANALISNASIQNFRSAIFNLGSALSGRVVVDTSLADTHVGTLNANTVLQFSKWAPTNTSRSINLKLTFGNADAVLQFPSECVSSNNNFGMTLLENYKDINGIATITKPAESDVVEFKLTTLNCGNTISVTPINRPFNATQIIEREPGPVGKVGDTNGTVAIGPQKTQVRVSETANLSVEITANVAVMLDSTISISGNDLSTSGDILTVGTLDSGTIVPGMILTGTGVASDTFIVENIGGDPLTWRVLPSQLVATTTITGTTGIVGNKLIVGTENSGEVRKGMILTGGDILPNTRVLELDSGSGNTAVWLVSNTQITSASPITGVVDVLFADDTSELETETSITFTGSTFGNIDVGVEYYVESVITDTEFTISEQPSGNMHVVTTGTGAMFANPAAYLYMCVDDFQGSPETKTLTGISEEDNIITLTNTNGVEVNTPVFFNGVSDDTNLVENQIYYIKTKDNSNITVSTTRFNGVAGATVQIIGTTSSGSMSYVENGKDIWRRVNLAAW